MAATGSQWQAHAAHSMGFAAQAVRWSAGGASAWAQAWRLDAGGTRHFVKAARGAYRTMVDAEADGLRALAATAAIRVPRVVTTGTQGDVAFLVLEWLDLEGALDHAALGRALAVLHRAPAPRGPGGERFGWPRDNWIGGAEQRNGWRDDWATFFRDARLLPQLERASQNGYGSALARDGARLAAALPALLRGHDPAPSLVHGDLWSGNVAGMRDGTPAIFDPAAYVGDREVDLAMTELFGGFAPAFRAAYREAWPLLDGYATRRTLYNLYHVLNHLNLFGESYLARAKRDVATLLAQAG